MTPDEMDEIGCRWIELPDDLDRVDLLRQVMQRISEEHGCCSTRLYRKHKPWWAPGTRTVLSELHTTHWVHVLSSFELPIPAKKNRNSPRGEGGRFEAAEPMFQPYSGARPRPLRMCECGRPATTVRVFTVGYETNSTGALEMCDKCARMFDEDEDHG